MSVRYESSIRIRQECVSGTSQHLVNWKLCHPEHQITSFRVDIVNSVEASYALLTKSPHVFLLSRDIRAHVIL